jgi:hypothetical protein
VNAFRAREEQADKLFKEIIEIADDASDDYVTTSDSERIVDHSRLGSMAVKLDGDFAEVAQSRAGDNRASPAGRSIRSSQGGGRFRARHHHAPSRENRTKEAVMTSNQANARCNNDCLV